MIDLIASIRTDAAALADIAEIDPYAPIARYPGWTQIDLLVHVGSLHRRTTETIRTAAAERVGRTFPADEEPAALLSWFRAGAEDLAAVLEGADPSMRVWGLGPEPTVGSWLIRMALETAVHRWDAQLPRGEPDPIDPELAVLGIDEFAALWSGSVVIGGHTSPLCLRATDGRQSWRLAPAGEGISFERGEGTESVSGTAATLYLWLLGRASLADLDTSSDAEAWQAAIKALPDARR
jgi:uncharacterized protein (TIGR03083 family)